MPPAVTTTISFLLMKLGGDECPVAPCISYALLNAENAGSPAASTLDRHFAGLGVQLVDQMVWGVVGKPITRWISSEDGR